ncbi:hypothetical protein K5D56_25595 [Pseudomonas cichorii]|nr:hypothetical protein [Pseudomonas cichorii]MBX8556974.1 hypothetical protein [Pseudomonas cichorii]MBX8592751.1 hypothetical protein [Pseudomonas cichorii]
MLNPQHSSSLHTQPPGVCENHVAWLPKVVIDLSYWHGGRKLKDVERFEWPGEVVEGTAIEHAHLSCTHFGIQPSSTLEMWAFRTDWVIANTRSDIDQHWSSVDPQPRAIHKILMSHRPVWSSKQGVLPALQQWRMFDAVFIKFTAVKTSLLCDEDLSEHITALLVEPAPIAGLQDLAVVDGRIADLKVIRRGDSPTGGQLVLVTGSVRVAIGPQSTPKTEMEVVQTVNSVLDVQLVPTSELLELDRSDAIMSPMDWQIRPRVSQYDNP